MDWSHILCNVVFFLKVQLQSHMIYSIIAFIGIKVFLTLGFAENTLDLYPQKLETQNVKTGIQKRTIKKNQT